ncbi:hypothetical protein FACS189413_01730 [Bacteroidia bacterium]|nr:hypothetical protein FACS189413_01730 [Bacteroidia bacterium]
MKRTTILTIAICLAINTFAERTSFRNRTENWLQNTEATSETSGNLRGAIGSTENADGNLSVPVGALPAAGILLLGSIYGRLRKKQ